MDEKNDWLQVYSPDAHPRADKRAGRRYVLRVPIEVRWGTNREYCVKGITQDLNDNGVLFRAKAEFPLGSDLELTFTVPRPFTTRETFHFLGTVVRTEGSGESTKSFAVQVRESEVARQPSETPTSKTPTEANSDLPAKKASWFGLDVTPRQLEQPGCGGHADEERPRSRGDSFPEPKLLLEWEPRWRNFVSSVRPAVARSAARLEAECDRTLALVHGPLTSFVLHFSAVALLFLPLAHSSRVRLQNPLGKGSEVIYFSGPYLPELTDRGGAQYGRRGTSGGSQSSNAQGIQVARGNSLAKTSVDAAKLYLPPSPQPVSNLVALTRNGRDPSLLDRARSLFESPAAPAENSGPPVSMDKAHAKPPETRKSARNSIRAPYPRLRKAAFKHGREPRREQIKHEPVLVKEDDALHSVVKAISSAVNSVTGAKPSVPAVIVSARPGSVLGMPATADSGPLAMSPEGGAKGGLGGSGAGLGVGRGNGSGKAQAGSGPGSSLADTGSGSDPFRGKSPAPGLGGAGKGDSDESNGVSIQGATVTVRSFGAAPPSEKLSSRSKHSRRVSENTPMVTVVASSRSGGGMDEYGALRGTKVYSVYISTTRGPTVLQYSEHSPKSRGFEDDLSAPAPINVELPSAFSSKRFVVACMIDHSGVLRNFRVLENNTSDSVAKMFAVLERWRFRPALRDTEAVDIDAILGFNLDAH
jgi:hypothetical protein